MSPELGLAGASSSATCSSDFTPPTFAQPTTDLSTRERYQTPLPDLSTLETFLDELGDVQRRLVHLAEHRKNRRRLDLPARDIQILRETLFHNFFVLRNRVMRIKRVFDAVKQEYTQDGGVFDLEVVGEQVGAVLELYRMLKRKFYGGR